MVITIGRQFGSQGHDIGKALAQKLNIDFYDKELLDIAAKEGGLSSELVEKYDEKASNSLLYSLSLGASATINSEYGTAPQTPLNEKLYLLEYNIIRRVAEESCVIVGRCADHVLADRNDLLRVFVYADDEAKVQHIAWKYSVTPEKARSMIKKNDKSRANYYNSYASGKWGDPSNYDLCINRSLLGVEGSAELLIACLRIKNLL